MVFVGNFVTVENFNIKKLIIIIEDELFVHPVDIY